MAISGSAKTLSCEQCGAPLVALAGEQGCLNCLLSTGIESEAAPASPLPNESKASPYQHYEILTRPDGSLWELGRGARGVTYKARDVNLNTLVALKVIDAGYSGRPEARRRFLREAQAAAQLRHPNVASVFHFGTIHPDARGEEEGRAESGDCFYAMEFVEGESLEARVRRTGPLSVGSALEVALQVARALAAAERRGLVHRHLKPADILLATADEPGAADRPDAPAVGTWVKVIDFGLTRFGRDVDGSSEQEGLPAAPAFAGSEQKEAEEASAHSDIYSLGEILYHAMSGKMPGAVPTNEPLALPGPGVPASVMELLRSMLAADPVERPASAQEVIERLQHCRHQVAGGIPSSRRHARRWAAVAGLAVAAALIALAVYLTRPSTIGEDKSIAVLPFRNLSNDPANAFFAEGVQDDILSRLVKIRDLKVISRFAASHYPAGAPRDLPAIGRTLGVRHLLEGSLRREGDRVRLHVSLVDSRDGHEVWSEGYNRTLADAINLQGELAAKIAGALDATLSPHEQADVRARTTTNPDAYVLYLAGCKLERNPAFAISSFEEAEALYRHAVTLDPKFALAHARLAITLGLLYRFRGPSEELRLLTQAEAREALRLSPHLGEAHLAQGLYCYRVERDYARALPELKIARQLLPNDTEAEATIAYIDRRKGQWSAALAEQERALARDPLNHAFEHEIHATACLLRDWPAAARHIAHAASLAPKMRPLRGEQALISLWWKGDLAPLQRYFAASSDYGDPEGNEAWLHWDTAMLARDFPAAQAAIDAFPFETLPSVLSGPIPKAYLEGCLHLAQGDAPGAAQFFESARPAMEAEAVAHPENALRHARLGLLYAYLGRKADALREGERALQLTPVEKDAIEGHQGVCNLALIHARIGEADKAISMIEKLLREPGCVAPLNEASMSLWELRLRWQWDPLRKDARFQKILASAAPATVF